MNAPETAPAASGVAQRRWSVAEAVDLFELPLPELMFRAQQVHRQHFDPAEVQLATLLSIKTGGCPEDCAYCPQSAHHDTGLKVGALLELQSVVDAARRARDAGATRFCMGAAWRSPKPRQLESVARMVSEVKALGLQTCVTLGMLQPGQAEQLRDAGLDYYNHNLDTSPEFYGNIISTRCYEDRLDTLEQVRSAGIKVCCGGIVGMGESRTQRAGLLVQLANLEPYPESVPINNLVRVAGTPLAEQAPLDPLEFVRSIAVARILMPRARVRLSAGRESMDDSLQALCLLAGANSIFFGDTLLTTPNPQASADLALLQRMGMRAQPSQETH
ncbi:MAG: biotin synthase BioB [Proteobacteria bacterium]|nr:biotin synthase BioB [Pseudomonadota bacterium]